MGSIYSKFISKSKRKQINEKSSNNPEDNPTSSSSSSNTAEKSCSKKNDETAKQSTSSSLSNSNNNTSSTFTSSSNTKVQRSDSHEHLKLGSLTETWKNPTQWSKFKEYLKTLNEGYDSDNVPLSLHRYALFLELYVALDQAERKKKLSDGEILAIIDGIRHHSEDFFGRERCLKVIDSGMRSQILKNVKSVRESSTEYKPGLWVYQPAYPRVLDKLNELVGTFQDPSSLQN